MRLRTFGSVRIEGAAQELGGAAGQRRPLALLLLVAAAGDGGVTRDKLMALLWPESDTEHARNALRQTLHSLRRDLHAPELFVGASDVRFNASTLTSDLAEFDAAVASKDHERVVALYEAPLADGFHLTNAPEFERWLDDERRARAQQFAEAIEPLAADAARHGNAEQAVALWRKLATHDRLSSRVAIRLMQALAAAGDRAAAIQHARVYEALVRTELDAAPDPAVAALAEELRSDARAGARPRSKAGGPSPATVAPGIEPMVGPRVAVAERPAAPAFEPLRTDQLAAAREELTSPPIRTGAGRTSGGRWRDRLARLSGARGVRAALYAVGAVGIATAFMVRAGERGGAAGLDASSYLVLPFRTIGNAAYIGLTGDQAERMLYEAISRWEDVRPVDALRVGDLLARDGMPDDLQEALAAARSFRARYLAWGTLSRLRDSIRVHASLYDVAQDDSARSAITHVPVNLDGIEARFRQLADSLLLGRSRNPPAVVSGDVGTTRLAARRAYDRGHSALGQWKLAEAAGNFRSAAAADPGFAQAWFWFAQVSSWLGEDSTGEGRRAALRAVEFRPRLAPRDQVAASALAALAADQHPSACARYRELLVRDSTDFAAWYGLGECQAMDSVVVEDPRSPSGRSFRASYYGASSAYARALDLVPSFHLAFRDRAYARVASLFFTTPLRVRYGIEVRGSDTLVLAAWPALQADTLAFVPYPIDAFRAGDPGTRPPTRAQALAHNRLRLRRVAETWAATFPNSVDALETLVLALEGFGEVAPIAGREGALSVVRRARAIRPVGEAASALRLAATEVRLLVKSDSLTRARALADSILAAASSGSRSAAQDTIVAAIAALTGRISRTASLMAHAAPLITPVTPQAEPVAVPLAVRTAAQQLVGVAAFGGPADTLRALEARLEGLIRAHVEPQSQPRVRSAVLYMPLRLAYAQLAARNSLPPQVGEDRLIGLYQALDRGDHRAIRTQLDAVAARRANIAAGDLSPEVLLQEIIVRTRMGDTASAVTTLDQMLEAIPAMTAPGLRHPFGAAALVRAMALRAELAAAARDAPTARRWSTAVVTLWSGADPYLQPVVARLRAIAGATS